MKRDPWFVPALPAVGRLATATVTDVADPDRLGRVKLKLHAFDDDAGDHGWARVVQPIAGDGYGAFLVPNVDDEVLVGFVGDDARQMLVLGSLWHGGAAPPDDAAGSTAGGETTVWQIAARAGSRVHIEEQSGGSSRTLQLRVGGDSSRLHIDLKNEGVETIDVVCGNHTIKLDAAGVEVRSSGTVKVQATTVEITASSVTVDAPMARFSGMVRCEVLQASSVISSSYTPGAGNVW